MAPNSKAVDPSAAALSAIEEALNLGDFEAAAHQGGETPAVQPAPASSEAGATGKSGARMPDASAFDLAPPVVATIGRP